MNLRCTSYVRLSCRTVRRECRTYRFLLGATLTLGLAVLLCLPAPSRGAEELSREQQIADLERQIAELTKKLNELKSQQPAPPKQQECLPDSWVKALHWRCIGPAAMGGRIIALAVYEADPSTYWVATASGGLLKTTNNGTTFEHQFDREATVSIGDVAVAQADRNIVWVGTGENNPRNSVSWGDGVYKSTDGGKTWTNMGLKKSFQIGKILIHPKDPNIVYVGALGRLYGPGGERGLFKTTDGGKTWDRILNVDDKTGVIDMRMSPADPETLLVATWERKRDEFDSHPGDEPMADGYDGYDPIQKWGRGGGIHKTTDGGKHWKKITEGLPSNPTGRIGLDWYVKDPKIVYAIIDCEKIGMGTPPRDGSSGAYMGISGETIELPDKKKAVKLESVTPGSPAGKAGLRSGDIVLRVNDKPVENYDAFVKVIQGSKVGDKLTLIVRRDKDDKTFDVTLAARTTRPYSGQYGGQRPNVQGQQGPNSHEYGGVYRSDNGGDTWTRVNSVNPRPMYFSQVRVDPNDNTHLYVLGVSMYRSKDGGKTFAAAGERQVHPDQHCLWINPRDGRHMIVGCDGGFYVTYDRMEHWDHLNNAAIGQFYHVCVDTRKPYRVYGGLQDNGSWGGPSRTLNSTGPINEDWIEVGGGDGFVCRVDPTDPDLVYFESQDGVMQRRNLRTGEGRLIRPGVTPGAGRQQQSPHRFNWNTPFILSGHNPRIFYSAGEYVFRSVNQGVGQKPISPEITRTKRGSGTALSESPRNPDILWAGTDDGFLWVTKDGGKTWTNVTQKVPLPGPRWVASIEASRYKDERAYVAFDGHRSDDEEPYIFVTEDLGQTWKPLRANLPTGSTRVLREDMYKDNVLYLGTEFAAYASINRGQSWTKINNNLPTVAVHEFAQHPDGEIVAATHGRSLWVLDVTTLRQVKPETPAAGPTLYKPAAVVRWHTEPSHLSQWGHGSRRFIGENPPPGPQIYYSLSQKASKVSLKLVDYAGKTVRDLTIRATEPGLHHVAWAQQQGGGQGRRGGGQGALPPPGMYRLVLTVDGKELSQELKVNADPTLPPDLIAAENDLPDEDEWKEEEREKEDHGRKGRIDD